MERRIAVVVGLGYVGLPAAVAFGLRGKLVRGNRPLLVDVESLYDRAAASAARFTVFRL